MKNTIRLAVLLIAMLAIQHTAESQKTVSPATPTIETVFAKMEKANKDYPYLQGTVEKSIYTDFVTKLSFDKAGKIWISNAGNSTHQVKVEFDKPQKETWNLTSGLFVDYYPKTKSGKKVTFDKDRQPEAECVFLGLCSSTALIKQFYSVTVVGQETVNSVKTVLLELRPKDQKREDLFALIKLWLDADKWYPVQTQIIEKNKNYNIFKYSGFKTGSFSSSIFKLDLPKDAQMENHKF